MLCLILVAVNVFVCSITKLICSSWFYLIQFPSDPLSGQSCPLSFLQADKISFYSSPLPFLPLADCGVHSAIQYLPHMSLTCMFSYPPSPSFVCPATHFCSLKPPCLAFFFVSQLYDVVINDVLDLFSPVPHPLLTHNSFTLLNSCPPPSQSPTDKRLFSTFSFRSLKANTNQSPD